MVHWYPQLQSIYQKNKSHPISMQYRPSVDLRKENGIHRVNDRMFYQLFRLFLRLSVGRHNLTRFHLQVEAPYMLQCNICIYFNNVNLNQSNKYNDIWQLFFFLKSSEWFLNCKMQYKLIKKDMKLIKVWLFLSWIKFILSRWPFDLNL